MSGETGEIPRMAVQQPVPSTPPVKAPFWYRYRAGVGALLLVNLGIGGYVLSRPRPVIDANSLNPEKVESVEAEKKKTAPAQAPVPAVAPSVVAAPEWAPPPKKAISEEEQRQVLQWVLEERRKVKGLNKAEKARIDEEKRLLKELLRGSQLPPLF